MNIENVNKTIALMKFNRDLVDKTIDSDIPIAGFDMNVYMEKDGDDSLGNECGTVACIAGFATLADFNAPEIVFHVDHFSVGRDYLGLSEKDANDLFTPSERTGAYLATIHDGIAVMEHLRDTGEVDWSITDLEEKYLEKQRLYDDEDDY